jgi:hypothetical protein
MDPPPAGRGGTRRVAGAEPAAADRRAGIPDRLEADSAANDGDQTDKLRRITLADDLDNSGSWPISL